jgi:hypothetical protein
MQAGFTDLSRKGEIVWAYSRDKEPFPLNPTGHGASRDFYEDGKEVSADDIVTEFESFAAPVIARARKNEMQQSDVASLPDIVAHLEIRSQFLRESVFSVTDEFIDKMLETYSSPKQLFRLMKNYFQENPSILDEKMTENNIPESVKRIIKDFVDVNLDSAIEKFLPQGTNNFSMLLRERLINAFGCAVMAA